MNKYKYKIEGKFEFNFKYDEKKGDPFKTIDNEVSEIIARIDLPLGCEKVGKQIGTIENVEKELIKEDSDKK